MLPTSLQRIPEAFAADDGYRVGHEFILPESGEHLVTLTKSDRSPSTNYTADFMIR
jgi:hypothetical protein